MTNADTAVASALPPFNKQNFISMLAASTALTAGAGKVDNDVAIDRADGKLIELAGLYLWHAAQQSALDDAVDEACGRYQAPPIPEALHLRREDLFKLCLTEDRLAAYTIGGRQVRVFMDQSIFDELSGWVASIKSDPMLIGNEYVLARTAELCAAHEAYIAECKHAADEAGYTQAILATRQSEQTISDLLKEIALTRSNTLAGFAAKAQVALSRYTLGSLEPADLKFMMSDIAEGCHGGESDWTGALGMSLSIDAAALFAPGIAFKVRDAA